MHSLRLLRTLSKCGLLAALALAFSECGQTGHSAGSETHFLSDCVVDADCASGLRCLCQVCSLACDDISACSKALGNIPGLVCSAAGCPVGGQACDVSCSADSDCSAVRSGYECRASSCRSKASSTALPDAGESGGAGGSAGSSQAGAGGTSETIGGSGGNDGVAGSSSLAGAGGATCEGQNLALSGTASAETSLSGYSASKVIDNDVSTETGPEHSWMSDFERPATMPTPALPVSLEIELGAEHSIGRVELYFTAEYVIRSYILQYRSGTGWLDLDTVSDNVEPHRTHSFAPVTTSRVRIFGTSGPAHEPGHVRLNEVQIYCK